MSNSDLGFAAMALSIVVMCCLILAIVYVPGFGPSEDALRCDGQGGYWSSEDGLCHKSENPAAGLAA